jgi:hypothetical protein
VRLNEFSLSLSTTDGLRRMAVNFAKLPDLLKRDRHSDMKPTD